MTFTPTTTEQAYDALFRLVSTAAAFKSTERDMRNWSKLAASPPDQPALFQEQGRIVFDSKPNIPTIVRLQADLAILCDTSDTVKIPGKKLNALVDAVLTALRPGPCDDQRQTLGGLVYDCKPSGEGFYREATATSPQSYALIPIEIIIYQ